jgi:hypothetical protein
MEEFPFRNDQLVFYFSVAQPLGRCRWQELGSERCSQRFPISMILVGELRHHQLRAYPLRCPSLPLRPTIVECSGPSQPPCSLSEFGIRVAAQIANGNKPEGQVRF